MIPRLSWAGLSIPPARRLNGVASPADERQLAAAGSRSVVPLTYGQDRIGGLILNVLPTSGAGTTFLVQVLWGFGGHAIADPLINGEALPSGATVTHYLGAQTTPDAALVAAFALQSITYADTLEGYAYSVLSLPAASFGAELQITALFSGRKVYDPRLDDTQPGGTGAHRLADPTTWEWSDNPALALADFLASPLYGAGKGVLWESVALAANFADGTVSGGPGPSEKRRVVGVTFGVQSSVADVAEALRAYAGCFILPAQSLGASGEPGECEPPGEPAGSLFPSMTLFSGTNPFGNQSIAGAPEQARADFLSFLATGVSSEGFEGFSIGQDSGGSGLPVVFVGDAGTKEARIFGDGYVAVSSIDGRFNTTPGGAKWWETAGEMQITFSEPISALGFYVTDIADFSSQLDIELTDTNDETRTLRVYDAVAAASGACMFFGFVDSGTAYTSVNFILSGPGLDFIGIDDLVIAQAGQIEGPPPCPPSEPSGVPECAVQLLPDADGLAVATYRHDAGDIASITPLQLRDLGNSPTVVEIIYTDTSVVPWRDASAFAELPGVGSTRPYRLSQVRMPGVHRYSQARREAIERLNKLTLQDLSTTIEVFDQGVRHQVGDIIQVTHPIGVTDKLFRVMEVASPGPGRWVLSLLEHDPSSYSDVVEEPD